MKVRKERNNKNNNNNDNVTYSNCIKIEDIKYHNDINRLKQKRK